MAMIYFTQFLRPDGRKTIVSIDRPDPIAQLATVIVDKGFRFECEQLHDSSVSLTISDDWGDYAHELCANGPQVPQSVDALILGFDIANALKNREINRK